MNTRIDRFPSLLVVPLLAFLVATANAHAQSSFTIDWYSIDTGGGMSSGGPFTLHATIGQWDAGRMFNTVGLTLDGGFEPGVPSVVACPADFNGDHSLNSQDFFDFLEAFFRGVLAADFNHDGRVNSQDFFDFLTAFYAGCP